MCSSKPGGDPDLDPGLYLLNCNLPADVVQARYPALWKYLQEGEAARLHERYICRHRDPWYSQEDRPAARLLCSYMGRQAGSGRPFRFILNHSRATAANVYLMLYPKPLLAAALADSPTALAAVWQALGEIKLQTIVGEGRIYGGGLHKIEPKELGNVPAEGVLRALREFLPAKELRREIQGTLRFG